jgi:hypothetical protein
LGWALVVIEEEFTTKVFGTRASRIIVLFVAWFLVREAAARTSGFENGPILCPVRLLTGYPCPGCGGTRAMGAICLGQFEKAWSLNPLTFSVCLFLITWALKIAPLNMIVRHISAAFQKRSLALQIFSLIFVYGVAWIAALARFNSAIL